MSVKPEVILTDVAARQAAAAAVTGATPAEIATMLGTSKHAIKRLMNTSAFKNAVKEIGDDAMATAKQVIRAETGKMAQEVVRVLRASLAKDNLEAVKIALKVVGLEQPEPTTGDTTIQVVLPGAPSERTIEPEFRTITPEETDVEN